MIARRPARDGIASSGVEDLWPPAVVLGHALCKGNRCAVLEDVAAGVIIAARTKAFGRNLVRQVDDEA